MLSPSELGAIAAANLALQELSDDELLALSLAARLGTDPRHVMGYEPYGKVLFTVPSPDYPRAHDLVKVAFALAVEERFANVKAQA